VAERTAAATFSPAAVKTVWLSRNVISPCLQTLLVAILDLLIVVLYKCHSSTIFNLPTGVSHRSRDYAGQRTRATSTLLKPSNFSRSWMLTEARAVTSRTVRAPLRIPQPAG